MSKIRKDKHGMFVIINGGIYRPQRSEFDYPVPTRVYESSFSVGDVVKVKNRSQTPFCSVICESTREDWGLHGQSGKKSEEAWKPR